MKISLSLLLIGLVFCLNAQELVYPDSLAVVKNKIKAAKIFLVSDGIKNPQKEIRYDKSGRVIWEQTHGVSFYYAYTYDAKGRRTSTTQRGTNGELHQKFVDEYDDVKKTRTTKLYNLPDTAYPRFIYVYNSRNEQIRRDGLYNGVVENVQMLTYDDSGKVVASYDSSKIYRYASWMEHGKLVKKRTYDPQGKLLHEYKYTYDYFGRPWKMIDSSADTRVEHFENIFPKDGGPCEGVKLDGMTLNDKDLDWFRTGHPEFTPYIPEDYQDYGLPVPPVEIEHQTERDKKGNVIKDIMIWREGSMSERYEYVYEYEYF